jgi:hypothetical protein
MKLIFSALCALSGGLTGVGIEPELNTANLPYTLLEASRFQVMLVNNVQAYH